MKNVVFIGTKTGRIYYVGDECAASRYLIKKYPSLVESDALRREQRYPRCIYEEPMRKFVISSHEKHVL
ncbi:hypothetical protein CIRMBP1271_00423 [Enterococcus cecorum]|nr:hypothetical protein AA985_01065 [Enterococcus cecorum]CAI3254920.1 hypothetical protein CIRMBP1243_00075 [Enterococcus cecorum]CAI3255657.1 hypothetical protein CIRMBP1217_00062 [Enterococcus cecorum]CAI3255974.1 hypothetical protein CIRMBP1226_00090 [Enterococcus cecorum]CAI3256389.1 hypothetical protein CIRMBP1240_00091 [Enterococcus cecorum]